MFGLTPQPPLVSLCLQPSPQTAVKFSSTLGLQMTLYQTTLSDEANVFIKTNWPNLSATSPPANFAHLLPLPRSDEKKLASIKLVAQINQHTGSIERLVGHADIISPAVNLLCKMEARWRSNRRHLSRQASPLPVNTASTSISQFQLRAWVGKFESHENLPTSKSSRRFSDRQITTVFPHSCIPRFSKTVCLLYGTCPEWIWLHTSLHPLSRFCNMLFHLLLFCQ